MNTNAAERRNDNQQPKLRVTETRDDKNRSHGEHGDKDFYHPKFEVGGSDLRDTTYVPGYN